VRVAAARGRRQRPDREAARESSPAESTVAVAAA